MAKTEAEQDSNHKIDPALENGPVDQRECRDLLCCIFFVAHAAAMVFIFIYATVNGNPSYMTGFCAGQKNASNPVNVTQCSMFCGAGAPNNSAISLQVRDTYKYLYFPAPFALTDIMNGKGVCVSSCPNKTLGLDTLGLDSAGNQQCLFTNTFFSSCGQTAAQWAAGQYSQYSNVKDVSSMISSFSSFSLSNMTNSELFLVYQSTPFLNRVCVPSDPQLLNSSQVQQALSTLSSLTTNIYDLYYTYQAQLIVAGGALVVAYIYMLFLRFCSGVIIWLMIFINMCVLGALGYYFVDKGKLNPPIDATADTNKQNTYIGYAIWGIDGAFFLFICCMFNRIRLAIAIIKTATMFVRDVKSAMVVPIFFYLKLLVFFAIWIIGFIFIYALGTPQKSMYGPIAAFTGGTATYQNNSVDSRYILAWWIFAGLWKNAFLGALLQFVLASSVAIWYFGQGNAHAPVTRSYYRAFRYHWGSLAFGSFILAVVQFIRIVLTYIQSKINERPELKNNPVIKVVMCLLQCYFWCLEKCIKFLNKNAYIQIAINGKSFCGAAKDAFFIILKNPARMSAVAGIGSIFILMGKVIISGASTFGGYLLITKYSKFSVGMTSPLLPTVFMFFISWMIGMLIMSVYGMAADTILHCFLIDEELNKEKGRPPQFSPEPLRDFLEKADPKQSEKKE